MKVNLGDVAAQIHYDMVTDERNGYSQYPNRWGGDNGPSKTLTIYGRDYTYDPGSFDCSSSSIIAWRLALQGTPYEGALDGATYTGDMREVFVNSGLFTASLTPAKRGDLYLAEGKHVAMCQDGGSDGVFGYDCLSEFNRNEYHGATWGEPGDQDGYEAVTRAYYDDGWNTVLHYNGKADFDTEKPAALPKQVAGKPKNSLGMNYRGHVQDAGWLDPVHDGQTAGTTGQSARLEALKITPPEGMELTVVAHIEDVGDKTYKGVRRGKSSGTGSSKTDPIIGTTGKSRRLEAIKIIVTKWPASLKGYRIMYQAHVENVGWQKAVPEGKWAGTRGKSLRMEAVRIWMEKA